MNTAHEHALLNRDYMSAEQLQHFRNMLLQQKADVVHKMDGLFNESNALVSSKVTTVDLQQQMDFIDNIRIYESALCDIENALNRIASGQYGYCQACGNPIGLERLLTSPTEHYDNDCENYIKRLP